MEQFYKLKNKTDLVDKLKRFIANPTVTWYSKNAFEVAVVPRFIIESDKVICALIDEFKAQPAILKMNPMVFYRFHVDEFRNAALNLLVDGWDSETFYGEPTSNEELMQITQLHYEPNCMYLLNTSIPHCVINKQNQRFVFSLGFNSPLTYDLVANFCKEQGL